MCFNEGNPLCDSFVVLMKKEYCAMREFQTTAVAHFEPCRVFLEGEWFPLLHQSDKTGNSRKRKSGKTAAVLQFEKKEVHFSKTSEIQVRFLCI